MGNNFPTKKQSLWVFFCSFLFFVFSLTTATQNNFQSNLENFYPSRKLCGAFKFLLHMHHYFLYLLHISDG